MKTSDITPLGGSVYELEKGDGGRRQDKEDIIELKFGGVETDLTPQKLKEDADILWDPSKNHPLEQCQ